MKLGHRLLTFALGAALAAAPAAAQQASSTSYQWYWGAQAGALRYKTAAQPYYFDAVFGGHWLITAKRSALYLAYEQAHFSVPAVGLAANSQGGSPWVTQFSDVRRVLIGVMVMPVQGHIQPLLGGGFALMQVLSPAVNCSSGCASSTDSLNAQNDVNTAASNAFIWASVGLQINFGKLGVFGQAFVNSATPTFLLQGPTFAIETGLRYSLGSSKEDISAED